MRIRPTAPLRSLLPLLLLSAAACGGSEPTVGTASAGSSGGETVAAPRGQSVHAAFVTEALPPDGTDVERSSVAVELRDETGATVRVELGQFIGCSEAEPTDTTLLSLRCYWAGTGDALHLTREADTLVVLREDLAEELTNAPRTPVRRIDLAPGATVDVGR